MLRTALLAIALMSPGLLQAGETPAQAGPSPGAPNSAQPCSDFEKRFPSCGVSKADKKRANEHYKLGTRLARQGKFDDALNELRQARAIAPADTVLEAAEKAVQEKIVAENLRKGNTAMQKGDAATALGAFRRATEVDPRNEYAEQRLRDALPAPEELGTARLRAEMGETRLQPTPGAQSFEFNGSSTGLLQQFAHAYGISAVTDQSLTSRTVRVKLDNVDWETGSQILSRLCKVLIIPMSEHQVLLANDTEENRRDLVRMSLRTFYALGGDSPQELTDLTTALRVLFDLRFITPNAAQGSIVIRAPQATMDAVTEFLNYLQDDRPTVMVDVKVFQVSSDLAKAVGTTAPTSFTVFNVTSEINNLVSSNQYSQIVSALQAANQPVNSSTILAALLATSSSGSSVLTQPFATFGGGLTLSGVTIPSVTAKLSSNKSLARTVEDVLLRAGHGKAATLKVGERYPIVSSQFSATNAATSILSSLGLGTTAGTGTSVPSPQFTYEDLGLTFKATPQVHGKLISMDYELTLRALGATQSNGLPLVTNREMKGSISTDDGESVVIAGLVEKNEMASINGIPLLSLIPGLGKAFSTESKEHTADELLVVVTPHVISGRTRSAGAYIPVPMNVPK